MDFEKIKFTIAKIQFENLQLNADKTAIEANQSTHKIAEWIHDNFVPLGAEVIVKIAEVEEMQKLLDMLKTENEKLRFMIDNGLDWQDMINDITYPPRD